MIKKILFVIGILFGGIVYGNNKEVEEIIVQMGFDAMECTFKEMAQVKPEDDNEERKLFDILWKRCVNEGLGKISFSERIKLNRHYEKNRELVHQKLIEGAKFYAETLISPFQIR
ncbi:hypothetical protein [Helicobacter ganmani]|uniref:hypothetical protein n=1 Tax=Helicobacter ganmani TaxID=60246 RepID=UPI003A866DC2